MTILRQEHDTISISVDIVNEYIAWRQTTLGGDGNIRKVMQETLHMSTLRICTVINNTTTTTTTTNHSLKQQTYKIIYIIQFNVTTTSAEQTKIEHDDYSSLTHSSFRLNVY